MVERQPSKLHVAGSSPVSRFRLAGIPARAAFALQGVARMFQKVFAVMALATWGNNRLLGDRRASA